MFCSKCGYELKDLANFCKSCGEPTVDELSSNNLADQHPAIKPAKQGKKLRRGLVAVFAVLVLVGSAGFFWLMNQNQGLTEASAMERIVTVQDLPFEAEDQALGVFDSYWIRANCEAIGSSLEDAVNSPNVWAYAGFSNIAGEPQRNVQQVIFGMDSEEEAYALSLSLVQLGSDSACDAFTVIDGGGSYQVTFGESEAIDNIYGVDLQGQRIHISHVIVNEGISGLQVDLIVALKGRVVTVIEFRYGGVFSNEFDPVVAELLSRFAD